MMTAKIRTTAVIWAAVLVGVVTGCANAEPEPAVGRLAPTGQASATPVIENWSSKGGHPRNKADQRDLVYPVKPADKITFSITTTNACEHVWAVRKGAKVLTSEIRKGVRQSSFSWKAPQAKATWEIEAAACGRKAAVGPTRNVRKIWTVTTSSLKTVRAGESIQKAIDSLPGEGGIIELAAGMHLITATINITNRKNITVVGAGMRQTTIKYSGRFFQVNSSEAIVLGDLGLVGGGGINLYANTKDSVVRNIYIKTADDYKTSDNRDGIGVGNAPHGPPFENNVLIRDNVVYGKPLYAYDYARNVTFDGNVVDGSHGPTYAAIDANRTSSITMSNNEVRNSGQAHFSIGIYGTHNGKVFGNLIENNTKGIWVRDIGKCPIITNNIIRWNAGNYKGEGFGVMLHHTYPVKKHACVSVIRNNLIYGNSGGGIVILVKTRGHPNPIYNTIESNTIYGNRTGIENTSLQHGILRNNIIANNRKYGIIGAGMDMSCNNIWNNSKGNYSGCSAGIGDISKDPLFASSKDDFHLKSKAGRWVPKANKWVKDKMQSPCIDAGDPKSQYNNEPAPNGGRINIGAYGNTGEASRS